LAVNPVYAQGVWGPSDLGTLGGSTSPYAINNAGQVVGQSYTANYSAHAFLWTAAGGMVDLGTLAGGSSGSPFSGASAINNSGQVAGWSYTAGSVSMHPFLWTATDGMIDLSTLGGKYAAATGINNAAQVVGWSDMADNVTQHAFLWTAADGII